MKARRKGDDLPLYSRAVVEMAEERLPDPGDVDTEFWPVQMAGPPHKPGDSLTNGIGFDIVFRRVPTTNMSETEGPTYWRWELIGRVDPATP